MNEIEAMLSIATNVGELAVLYWVGTRVGRYDTLLDLMSNEIIRLRDRTHELSNVVMRQYADRGDRE